jgi:hypothetical protein
MNSTSTSANEYVVLAYLKYINYTDCLPNIILTNGIIENVPAVNERIRSRIMDFKPLTTVNRFGLRIISTVKSNLIISILLYKTGQRNS